MLTEHDLREARTLQANYRRALQLIEEQTKTIRLHQLEIAALKTALKRKDEETLDTPPRD